MEERGKGERGVSPALGKGGAEEEERAGEGREGGEGGGAVEEREGVEGRSGSANGSTGGLWGMEEHALRMALPSLSGEAEEAQTSTLSVSEG